jgi:sn-glycerol 3-phosphate transport system permease protein
MQKKVIFRGVALPVALLLPQLVITGIFFFWPAGQAIWSSFLREDAFGLSREFVGLENFSDVLTDPNYLTVVWNTAVFSVSVAVLAMGVALFLAVQADKAIRAATAFKTLLIWPYAVAPAVAAVLWLFLFHPQIGIFGRMLNNAGIMWDYKINGGQAMTLVIVAAAWKQVSYNFIFFLAGLQSIPKNVLEAAAISPTTFFLLVVNLVYAFFDTFGTIHALTQGGPGLATTTLIYKVYVDGVQNLNFGASAAQSVILMVLVMAMTAIQFRFIERKVHY